MKKSDEKKTQFIKESDEYRDLMKIKKGSHLEKFIKENVEE